MAWGVGMVVNSYDDVPLDVRNMVGHLIAIMSDELIQLLELDLESGLLTEYLGNMCGAPAATPARQGGAPASGCS